MEHYNFLADWCGKCLTPSCGSFVLRGARRYQGIAYHSDTGCQQGSWCKRGSDSVALACFHEEWGDIVTHGWAPQQKQEQSWHPWRLSTAMDGILFLLHILGDGSEFICVLFHVAFVQSSPWVHFPLYNFSSALEHLQTNEADSVMYWCWCLCLVRGCGYQVWLRQEGDNLTVSQVHFPRVSVVLHTSHTAVRVSIHSVTKRRQLPEIQ